MLEPERWEFQQRANAMTKRGILTLNLELPFPILWAETGRARGTCERKLALFGCKSKPQNSNTLVFGILKMHPDVDACDWTRGLYRHHKRVCTGSWQHRLWENNPLLHRGLEPASVHQLSCPHPSLNIACFHGEMFSCMHWKLTAQTLGEQPLAAPGTRTCISTPAELSPPLS